MPKPHRSDAGELRLQESNEDARLKLQDRAEFRAEADWKPAPRPLSEPWIPLGLDLWRAHQSIWLKIVLKSDVFIVNIRARLKTLEFKLQLVRRVELFQTRPKLELQS